MSVMAMFSITSALWLERQDVNDSLNSLGVFTLITFHFFYFKPKSYILTSQGRHSSVARASGRKSRSNTDAGSIPRCGK